VRLAIPAHELRPGKNDQSATTGWIFPAGDGDSLLTNSICTEIVESRLAALRSVSVLPSVFSVGGIQETVADPGLARCVVDNLSPATWYFAVTAYDVGALESDRSVTASVVIQ